MTVLSRFNTAINIAVKDGRLDRKKDGAIIEAARMMAQTMDRPGWPIIDGKFDNVTPSTFKQYCELLHLTPDSVKREVDKPQLSIVGNSKWKKEKTADD